MYSAVESFSEDVPHMRTAKSNVPKIVMVGPFPPPEGGWATAIREEREELEKRGIVCEVLDIGPNRLVFREGCIPVRGALDLFKKILSFALKGYLLRLHMNGDSPKGIAIVIFGELASLLSGKRACLSFHAGANQRYFPDRGRVFLRLVWSVVFGLAGTVVCDSEEVRSAIARYRDAGHVFAVSPFSPKRLRFREVPIETRLADFTERRKPLLFIYFAYRPEYQMEVFLEALEFVRHKKPQIGCVAVCDPSFPVASIEESVRKAISKRGLVDAMTITGHLSRDEFLTLLSRSDLFVRTAVTDGVCSSVLESLWLKVPVIAVENGCRPDSVITYRAGDSSDLSSKILEALGSLEALKARIAAVKGEMEDGAVRLADLVVERYFYK